MPPSMPQRINPYMVTSKASKTVDRHYQSLYQSHPLLCQTHVLWDDLSQLPQHMVSHYVDIEYHSLRVLHFSFRAVSLAAPHSPQFLLVLSQLRTALVQAMPPAPPPAAQLQPATPESRTRVEQQARRLFTTVFQLDSADEVNVPSFEWERVVYDSSSCSSLPGRTKARQTWLGEHDHGYVAYFAAALEGPAEAPAEGSLTRHQLRVLLPMYAPPSGADSVSSAGTAHGASYVALETHRTVR